MDVVRADVVSVVVVPAKDEAQLIGGCLRALARQTVPRSSFETIVVLDGCRDDTETVVREAAAALGLTVCLLAGPGIGAGAARRAGMDAAAELLASHGCTDGLIACTDADSRPAPDWLARQLEHLRNGARVVAGLIELDREESELLPGAVLRRRETNAASRLQRVRELTPGAAHHHFAGASLGIAAGVYRQVGGLDPVAALEDAAFAVKLGEHRVPVLYAADVRVQTSARRVGRARRGLALDIAVSAWSERRRYRASDFSLKILSHFKGATSVDVIVPTKECAATVADVLRSTVSPLAEAGLVDDVVVVDAGSADGTAQRAAAAGVRVLQQDELLPEYGPARGKGDAMWRALHATSGEIVCFLDGDTADPDPDHLRGLLGPLLTDASVQLVKGAFERPLRAGELDLANEGGRVTELMARPLLNLHEPRLAGFAQPLAGEFAARRTLLESLPFPVGYGIEIAILIDALREHGLDALAECHLGTRQNRHQPLRALGEMSYAVLAAVEKRVGGDRSTVGGHYLRPWQDGAVIQVPIDERPRLDSLRPVVSR
jgi:glycosyltransferase involved in cell wall biosynthesis